ncbi:MAG: type II toxin-antitoxin system RelE/ParE family toxin [Stellaceae bacterium]
MIRSFKDRDTEGLWKGERVKRLSGIRDQAVRKLDMLNAAVTLNDLGAAPGNRLEPLKRDRAGQYSIRINDKMRICFVWSDGAEDVEIVDYH